MFKRATYEGLDCLADKELDEYAQYHMLSQMEVPWADQAKYAKYTIYFGVATIFAALVKNVWYKYRDSRYLKLGARLGPVSAFVDIITAYCRFFAYKQVPAKVSFFTSLPPSVGTSLYLAASTFYLCAYCFIPHFWYRACRGFGSPPLAVRAGVMATALTPFIYVLAGKSNMITLLTGISYEKLNVVHQYVGVAALVLSLVHTIPFIWQPLHEGGAKNLQAAYNDSVYYLSGIPPLVLLAWLCMGSKKCVRKWCYEGFLHLHWACGIAYFGTLIWHINLSLDMQNYMWGALAFWASQLIYRAIVKTALKPNRMFLRSRKGELSRLGNSAFQISVDNISGLKWSPGQHCYLRFAGSRVLDNHPFSIGSVIEDEKLRFIVVPQKGLTKKLHDELELGIVKNKKVYIDGPYGGPSRDINAFDKVMMFATGSGVTVTLPFLRTLSQAEGRVQTIDFVWLVRDSSALSWLAQDLNECCKSSKNLNIHIYVCNGTEPSDSESEKKQVDEKSIENTTSLDSRINVHYYKPDVRYVMMGLAGKLLQRNLIISSGSELMRMMVSSTTSQLQTAVFNADLGGNYVEEVCLHTEAFGW